VSEGHELHQSAGRRSMEAEGRRGGMRGRGRGGKCGGEVMEALRTHEAQAMVKPIRLAMRSSTREEKVVSSSCT
jgi:hypothetical protein